MNSKITRRVFIFSALMMASCRRTSTKLKSVMVKAQETSSRRLMIVLHGLGDSAAGYVWLPEALHLPWLNYILVNAPFAYEDGYSWFQNESDIERITTLLSGFLDERRAEGWPAEQMMLFGFSQGCNLAWELGLRYPQRLAGIVGIDGCVNDLPRALGSLSSVARQQHYLITHGIEDPQVPFGFTSQQVQELKKAGLEIDWRPFHKGHTIADKEELDVIRNFIVARYPK
jgi:phospholipase/carboxylesterase